MKKVSPLILLVILLSTLAYAGSSDIVQKWIDFKAHVHAGGTSRGQAVDMGDGTFVVLTGSATGVCSGDCPAADGATSAQSMDALAAGIRLWATGTYSACSNACGDGTRTRAVTCVSPSGQVATDCDETKKPAASDTCHDMSGCSRSWSTGTFGTCAPACGASVQTRSVACLRSDGATIEDELCSGEKPALMQSCSDSTRCSYLWSAGEFGDCAADCSETSSRQRAVTCLRHDQTNTNTDVTIADASCSGVGTKPASTEACPSFTTCASPDATVSSPSDALAGNTVSFIPSLTGNVASCSWSFGDGTTSSGCNTQPHAYTAKGTYAPILSLIGVNSLQTKSVAVHAVNVWNPVAASSIAYVENSAVPFATTAPVSHFTFTPAGDPASCSWNFGDGTTAQTGCSNQTHSFASVGTKTVTVTITGSAGDIATKTLSVVVENAKSCLSIKNYNPASTSGVYYARGLNANVYCDMDSDGGGWQLVAVQYEWSAVEWSGGGTYDPTMTSNAGWAISTAYMPTTRTQTAFGLNKSATFIGYANFVYHTGQIPATYVQNLKTGYYHHIVRRNDGYYRNLDCEDTWWASTTNEWVAALSFDRAGGYFGSWGFAPRATPNMNRGHSMNGSNVMGSNESYAWTVWVR